MITPMKRGLKLEAIEIVSHVILLEVITPMKRGLKLRKNDILPRLVALK